VRRSLVALAAALAAVNAPHAHAATVSVQTVTEGRFSMGQELVFVAAPGESNRIRVLAAPGYTWPPDAPWTVHDDGAPLTPGERCTALDEHTVRCDPYPVPPAFAGIVTADVAALDGDDEVALEGEPNAVVHLRGGDGDDRVSGRGSLLRLRGGAGDDDLSAEAGENRLYGGPGDDRLAGGDAVDRLDGGSGRDELHGGGSFDRLSDGDRDGAGGGAGPGPDLLDGGPGNDKVSYRDRTAAVFVDLADAAPDGRRGEGDQLTRIEWVDGGHGDDELSGDEGRNRLNGRGGHDRLAARGGDDWLIRGGGRTSCGDGADIVRVTRNPRDFLLPDCEGLDPWFHQSPVLPAYPARVGRNSVRYRVSCPEAGDEDGSSEHERARCAGVLRFRQRFGDHRLLGEAPVPAGRWRRHPIDVPLTPAGRRLSGRAGGVRATVALAGRNLAPFGYSEELAADDPIRWSIRLRGAR
jgi:hypothetical protein